MLADTSLIEALLGRDLTDDEQARATPLLAMASAEVISATGQTFERATNDEVTLDCVEGEIWLPQGPIVDVTSVRVDPQFYDYTVPAYLWQVEGQTLRLDRPHYRWLNSNQSYPIRLGHLDRYTGKVTVIYGHGYDPLPADVTGSVAGAVANLLRLQSLRAANLDGKLLERAGAEEIRWDPAVVSAPVTGLVDADVIAALVARYRLAAWSPRAGR